MFANACTIASGFTRPLVISMRNFGGSVTCTHGAFIVINDEGWIMSAAHMLGPLNKYNLDQAAIRDYEAKKKEVEGNPVIQQRDKLLRGLKPNQDWLRNVSYWCDGDGVNIVDIKVVPGVDLFIGRLDAFKPSDISTYPKYINPNNICPGTSLCKLGFPFHEVKASYDNDKKVFNLEKGSIPMPLFPLEGLFTRNLIGPYEGGKVGPIYIETSSPGLKGQSGGPIFDRNGTVWAIQSYTHHISLGFNPTLEVEGKNVTEYQFLNVGVGVHPKIIEETLKKYNIKYEMVDG